MPLDIPNLDDLRFPDLVEEALAMLPEYAPEWTNHNPSDPGITLIELLAYFSENLIYRLNRISRQNKIKFLQLLRTIEASERERFADPETPVHLLDEALDQAVLALRKPQRAVICTDYERIAEGIATEEFGLSVKRAKCFMRTNLEAADAKKRDSDCPGHISVVIVSGSDDDRSKAGEILLDKVRAELEKKRLLTTRVHVSGPIFLSLSINATLHSCSMDSPDELQQEAAKKLNKFFSILPTAGDPGKGWPFGRSVYLSELYEQLEHIDGVDYVKEVRILRLSTVGNIKSLNETAVGVQIGIPSVATIGEGTRLGGAAGNGGDRLVKDKFGRLIAVKLRPYELVKVSIQAHNFFIAPPERRTKF